MPLSLCGDWYGGSTPSKLNEAYWREGTIPWISPKDMKQPRLAGSEDYISPLALKETNLKAFPAGTVLIVIRSGILSRTLPIAVADVEATMNQDLKGILPSAGIDSRYLAYFLQAEEREILRKCSKHGTTVASIDTNALHSYMLRIAPTREQRSIVAKIEELFSDLDAGVAALKRAKANLKTYRAAVLKAAVEGKLTAQWRTKNPTESASKLLERILLERRRKWEADQLAKFVAAGKEPPKNWKAKYVEPKAPDTTELSELPDGWCWATLGQIALFQNGRAFPSREYVQDGTRLLRPGNLFADGSVRWSEKNSRFMPPHWAKEFPAYLIRGNELVMNLTAQSLADEFLGRTCLTDSDELCLLNQRIARITPLSGIDKRFTLYLLKSALFRRFVNGLNTGSLIEHMFTSQLENCFVPMPPAAEQQEIVQEIERRLSVVEESTSQLEADLLRAARLRQSILKQAFEGRLVPQDPSDEPAHVMLERLQSTQVKRSRPKAIRTKTHTRERATP